jgi:hypothetical protein
MTQARFAGWMPQHVSWWTEAGSHQLGEGQKDNSRICIYIFRRHTVASKEPCRYMLANVTLTGCEYWSLGAPVTQPLRVSE